MNKILIKVLAVIAVIITGSFSLFGGYSFAITQIDANQTNLYNKGVCEKYLKYNGRLITTTYVVYNNGNTEYPAYCLNVDLPGVGEVGSYNVDTKEKVTDVGLWRVIINGYPYKTLEELGVETEQEAYTATKQAIYCYLYGRGTEKYEANGQMGENTMKALINILNNASQEKVNQVANIVKIESVSETWEVDNVNKEYLSKIYKVKSDAEITNYEIIENNKLPEGVIITDLSNIQRNTFKEGEEFKILFPIKSLQSDGQLEISVKTKINTKPVIYGKSMIEGNQNYALTAYSYEDAECKYIEKYNENNTQIKIIKRDADTEELLTGVEFALLDEEKNVVYSNLVTNENGEIIIKNMMPGKYYLKEVNGLEGYAVYTELLEIDLNFNCVVTVNIKNERQPQVSKDNPKEEVKKVEKTLINKLPVTGM